MLLIALAALGVVLAAVLLPASPPAGQQLRGVQAHLLWDDVSDEDLERQLDLAARGGAELLRVDMGWSNLEPHAKGELSRSYLARVDAVVAEARSRGLRLLMTFWRTPCWASSAPSASRGDCHRPDDAVYDYPPRDPRDYADALKQVVARYRGRVTAWEVWNEPNRRSFFKGRDPAGNYARLLSAAYVAAKQADSGTKIIGGSLAEADTEFARTLYANGIKGHLDAFAMHPYSEDRSPADPQRAHPEVSFVHGVPAIHDVMVANGDRSPIWLTEFGWSSCTERAAPAWRNCVSEKQQARYLRQGFEQMRQWDYVEAGVWYALSDRDHDRRELTSNFGLVRRDGSPKPAYEAFRSLGKGG
jgi:hypothetical protein